MASHIGGNLKRNILGCVKKITSGHPNYNLPTFYSQLTIAYLTYSLQTLTGVPSRRVEALYFGMDK